MRRAIAVAGCIWIATVNMALAQNEGDVRRGQAFAQQICAKCHALQRGQADSPHPQAPTFPVIAQVPGLTALALTVSLQSAHNAMPDLVLETQERHDVIAFILSLRRAN